MYKASHLSRSDIEGMKFASALISDILREEERANYKSTPSFSKFNEDSIKQRIENEEFNKELLTKLSEKLQSKREEIVKSSNSKIKLMYFDNIVDCVIRSISWCESDIARAKEFDKWFKSEERYRVENFPYQRREEAFVGKYRECGLWRSDQDRVEADHKLNLKRLKEKFDRQTEPFPDFSRRRSDVVVDVAASSAARYPAFSPVAARQSSTLRAAGEFVIGGGSGSVK